MSLSTKDREKRVLECLEQNKNYREIQAQLHISSREISFIAKKAKEKYNNKSSQLSLLQEQLTLFREQIDLFSSRNKFLLHKNLELQDEFNLIRNKIKEISIGILRSKDPFIRSSIITILKIIKDDPEKEILINNNKNNNNQHSFDQKISEMVAKFIDTISETIVNSIINSKNNNYNIYNSQEKV